MIHECEDILGEFYIEELVLNLNISENKKIELMHEYKDKFSEFNIYNLILKLNIDETKKIDLIYECKDILGGLYIEELVLNLSISENKKIELIYRCSNILTGFNIYNLILKLNIDENKKIDLINKFENRLHVVHIYDLINKLNIEINKKVDLIYKYADKTYNLSIMDKANICIMFGKNEIFSRIFGKKFCYIVNTYTDSKLYLDIFDTLEGNNIEELNIKEIDNISKLIISVKNSNSIEIKRIYKELVYELRTLKYEDANEKIKQIENIFLGNNIPYGAKLFLVFNKLHPNFDGFNISSKVLNNNSLSQDQKYYILLIDSLKISIYSNPENILKYLNEVKVLNKNLNILLDLKNKNISYDEIIKKSYATDVNDLLNTAKSWGFVFGFSETIDNKSLYNMLNKELIDGIYNYIISMLNEATNKNFQKVDEIINYINSNIVNINEKNRHMANNNDFKLQKGDLIKGVSEPEKYLYGMLKNGVNCKEFLGANATSDATNIDTDFSMITNNENTIEAQMHGTTASIFSNNVWIVLKNIENRFNTNGNINDSRMELFPFDVESNNYGIRTGVPSTEIDFIICDNWNGRIGFAIALNGFYIPVVNKSGELVFAPEDYDKMRSKMSGLSIYGVDSVPILSNNCFLEGFNYLRDRISNDKENTKNKFEEVFRVLSGMISKYSDNVYPNIMNLTYKGVELIDTGSTSRNNNMPNDYDFDLMCRMDNSIFSTNLKNELVSNIEQELIALGGIPNVGNNPPERIRYNDVLINGIPTPIDISFTNRTNSVEYTTDVALKDKMVSIEKTYGIDKADYVRANIIVGKQLFKKNNCYKKPNGITGVGVENFILQNNGSLFDAIDNYISEYEKYKSVEDFKNHYSIFDMGLNFYNNQNDGHDNFIYMLGNDGIKKMYEVFKQFKINYFNSPDKIQFINQVISDDLVEKKSSDKRIL